MLSRPKLFGQVNTYCRVVYTFQHNCNPINQVTEKSVIWDRRNKDIATPNVKLPLTSTLKNLFKRLRGRCPGSPLILAAPAIQPNETFSEPPIPEPPPIPELPYVDEVYDTVVESFNHLGEKTFTSLGLASNWTPVGWLQSCFEFLHVNLELPWWQCIVLGTITIRFLMFPVVIIAQRNAAIMHNNLPQMQMLQLKMTEARQSGNVIETAQYSHDLMAFMKEKKLNPFKNMIVPMCQAPVFISFFMALRQMSNIPIESLRTGGILWFTDLTIPDQYYLMPLITSTTLWLTIELGADSAKVTSQNLQTMKYVLRALPVLILPFIVNFPGAILCYWVSSNFISLGQVAFLKIPAVREYFKIQKLMTHDKENLPAKSKGFTAGVRDSWTNLKITSELEERRKLDDILFQRAGKGPLTKTYKFDPTRLMQAASSKK